VTINVTIKTWGWPTQAETCSDFEDFKKWQLILILMLILTFEDGQFRPKHVVILKILKSDN
jgi:hypothetical protein